MRDSSSSSSANVLCRGAVMLSFGLGLAVARPGTVSTGVLSLLGRPSQSPRASMALRYPPEVQGIAFLHRRADVDVGEPALGLGLVHVVQRQHPNQAFEDQRRVAVLAPQRVQLAYKGLPARDAGAEVVVSEQVQVGEHVDGNERSVIAQPLHDVDGQVVEHAAVDQEIAFGQDGEKSPGMAVGAGAPCLEIGLRWPARGTAYSLAWRPR